MNKEEVIEVMINSFNNKNKEMAELSGMSNEDIEKFIAESSVSIKMMLDDPKLNHNDSTAFYGMAAKIPDSRILGDVAKIYNGAILDAIWSRISKKH